MNRSEKTASTLATNRIANNNPHKDAQRPTSVRKAAFLAAVALKGTLSEAAKLCGFNRTMHNIWISPKYDPRGEYRKAFDEARKRYETRAVVDDQLLPAPRKAKRLPTAVDIIVQRRGDYGKCEEFSVARAFGELADLNGEVTISLDDLALYTRLTKRCVWGWVDQFRERGHITLISVNFDDRGKKVDSTYRLNLGGVPFRAIPRDIARVIRQMASLPVTATQNAILRVGAYHCSLPERICVLSYERWTIEAGLSPGSGTNIGKHFNVLEQAKRLGRHPRFDEHGWPQANAWQLPPGGGAGPEGFLPEGAVTIDSPRNRVGPGRKLRPTKPSETARYLLLKHLELAGRDGVTRSPKSFARLLRISLPTFFQLKKKLKEQGAIVQDETLHSGGYRMMTLRSLAPTVPTKPRPLTPAPKTVVPVAKKHPLHNFDEDQKAIAARNARDATSYLDYAERNHKAALPLPRAWLQLDQPPADWLEARHMPECIGLLKTDYSRKKRWKPGKRRKLQ